MPTIDQLAPATSASDSDELVVSQSGIARKITRALALTGVQPEINLPSGALLGRASAATGAPEVINLGSNLVLNGSTLSAAAPFVIGALPAGSVPSAGDSIPISQSGTSAAITYSQLVSGLSSAPNLDLSNALVTSVGGNTALTLGALASNSLSSSGGTLRGPLVLAAAPTMALQAANKAYVDQQLATLLPVSGGSMRGLLTLAGSPQGTLDAATKSYVDLAITISLPLAGGSLTGPLILNADPTVPGQASTKRYADLKVARSGDTMTGTLVLAQDPVSPAQAATKNYVDSQIVTTVPRSGATLLGALVLNGDPTLNAQAATKQYVDQRLQRNGDTLAGMLTLFADPTVPAHAVTKNYADALSAGSVARSGSSMTGALVLTSDPTTPLQASTKQYVDLRVSRMGDTLAGALYLASDPSSPLQASTKQYVDNQFAVSVAKSGTTFTGPVSLAADPVSAMQAVTKQYADARVSRSGDSLTGGLMLAADPTLPAQAATKNYVDAQAATRLPVAGGSLAGSLLLASDPVAPVQAATKQYVDGQVAKALPLSGGTVSGTISLSTNPSLPAHTTNKGYVDGQIAGVLRVTGGSLTGPLSLASAPTLPLHASTKAYVDANPNAAKVINVMLPPFGALLDGVTDDTLAFKAAYQAAPVGGTIYVPNGTTVLQQPGTWGIALTKLVKWVVDGTILPDGTPLAAAIPTGGAPGPYALPGVVIGNTHTGLTVSQGGSQATDFSVNQSSYIVAHAGGQNGLVSTNVRADTIIYESPGNYIWGGLDRLIWTGIQTPNAGTPAQHVARYMQTFRQATTLGTNGQPLPQPQLWAACLEYRDTTGKPSSLTAAGLTVEMDWFGNGLDDGNSRTIQSLVVGQHDPKGAPVELANIIGVYLAGGSSGSTKTVFGIGIPFSNAVLDTTYAVSVNNAPVIKLLAGQAIAFEQTNTYRLSYDSTTTTLRWNQGTLSFPVGKGISVGWVNVLSASSSLPNYISGNLILLVGSSSYTVTLPPANTVAAGVGYTFSVTGTGAATIAPSGSDGIDCGPVVLRPNDRYHIVSDGSSFWHEIFRSNAVSPRFTAPIVLPSYTVSALPTASVAGAKAFTTNGRKPNEAAGSGSGVEVFFDGQRWISSCSGLAVAA